jgi:hypothetical protein
VSLRVGAIQSAYIPWRGYFDFIASVDLFVVYDDVPYSKNSWRNRNRIKTPRGTEWLTIPVHGRLDDSIDEVTIADPSFVVRHRSKLIESLGQAPYFAQAMEVWEAGVKPGHSNLSAQNVALIRSVCSYLGITTPLAFSRDLGLHGTKTDRLLDLLRRTGGTTYVSGPTAKDYLDEALLAANNITLEYKTYDYEPYSQLFGPFVGEVTVLDLIANEGPRSRELIRSRSLGAERAK